MAHRARRVRVGPWGAHTGPVRCRRTSREGPPAPIGRLWRTTRKVRSTWRADGALLEWARVARSAAGSSRHEMARGARHLDRAPPAHGIYSHTHTHYSYNLTGNPKHFRNDPGTERRGQSERPPRGIQIRIGRHNTVSRTRATTLYFRIQFGTMHHNPSASGLVLVMSWSCPGPGPVPGLCPHIHKCIHTHAHTYKNT